MSRAKKLIIKEKLLNLKMAASYLLLFVLNHQLFYVYFGLLIALLVSFLEIHTSLLSILQLFLF